MSNVLLLTFNTLKLIFRKKGNIILYFLLPLAGILLSVVAYGNTGSSPVNLAVVDKDKSMMAGDFMQSLTQEGKFKLTTIEEKNIDQEITSNQAEAVLVIPQGFAEGVYQENLKPIEIVSIKGEAATAWIQNYTNIYLKNLHDLAAASGGNRDTFNTIYNHFKQDKLALKVSAVKDQAQSKGMTAQSIGFLIMFMMLGAGNVAEIIQKEKINRTYYRICAAPVTSRTYVFGNVLTNLVIVMIQVFLTLLFMTRVFNIQIFIPFWQLYMILVLFGLVAIGLGLLIIAFTNDSKQAGTLQNLIITPTCMLAGCFWPLDVMPKAIQRIADFLPQTWVITAVQKLQEGGTLSQVSINLSIIVAFALSFFLIAAYRFSRNNSVKTFV